MIHEYDDGSTKIRVEVHDNAPDTIKLKHLRVFNHLVSLIVKCQKKEPKERIVSNETRDPHLEDDEMQIGGGCHQ